ncbi:CotH kinase family protein [Ruminococcus sp.]|uniref:CotH kinase family protein n=1 Tax=Ruminococcus sp. TaxID=41978 RepID=UPI0025CC5E17|nr:CotH kinase family protein [Ruminococcus sp.]
MKIVFKRSLGIILSALIFYSINSDSLAELSLFSEPLTSYAKKDEKVDEKEDETEIRIDKSYLKVGEQLSISNSEKYSLVFYVDNVKVDSSPFILAPEYYEKWIRVEAYDTDSGKLVSTDSAFFSNLPVIYINTDDKKEIISKTDYKSGDMIIQNNTDSSQIYSGSIKIRGRGNSAWLWPKKPYRIKLDKKTDLFGMGSNKNWVLIANYLDESLIRNTTAFQISEELGLTTMQSVWTDVVLNGEYAGNYQLCEQIRIDEDRVNIFDWEAEAKEIASAVYKKEKKAGNNLDKDALEDQLTTDLSWVTTGVFSFNDMLYNINAYYDVEDDISGGYLFELSNEFDEISRFQTDAELKVMIKSPEYLKTDPDMMDYVQKYWQDFENAYMSEDGYVDTDEGNKHYTEFADIDSMVSYWLVMEIMGNKDSIYKSRYAYKDKNELIKFGPVWDFDWGCGSLAVGPEATGWKITRYNNTQNFYKEFLDDPLFISKATEKYWEIRPYLEKLIENNGIIDSEHEYLSKSGDADKNRWDRHKTWPDTARGFEGDITAFKTYLTDRIAWLDKQFATDKALLNSIRTPHSSFPYVKSDDIITIESANASEDNITGNAPADYVIETGKDLLLDVQINDAATKSVNIYVNGIFYGNETISNGKIGFEVANDTLTAKKGNKNVISFIGKNADGITTYKNFITVIQNDPQLESSPSFKRINLVLSGKIGVNFYLDLSSLTEAEKEASYVEFTVNGKTAKDTYDANFVSNSGQYYGFTCYVTSAEMADTITAVYHYGVGQTLTKTYSVLEYINKIEENADSYDAKTLDLIHSIADYGHYAQPWLAENNNWTVGKEHIAMEKHYTDSYSYESVKENVEPFKRILDLGGSDIQQITYSLSLDAATELNIFIQPKKEYDGEVTVTINKDGEPASYKSVKQSDNRYKITIPNISAHKLGYTYSVTAATSDGTATCSVSALSYIYAILNSDSYDDTAKNAVSSFYNYYDATMKYLDQN